MDTCAVPITKVIRLRTTSDKENEIKVQIDG